MPQISQSDRKLPTLNNLAGGNIRIKKKMERNNSQSSLILDQDFAVNDTNSTAVKSSSYI